jgi:GNAT superfamily N-acetyltransferase/predicted nucleic acid-binding protein
MSIRILSIDHTLKYLDEVIALGDANKQTLGLFPKDAYKAHARKKWIIVAVADQTDKIAGYLLYYPSRRKMLVSIVHLCIDAPWRGQGIAKLLFDELRKLTGNGYPGVRVHCRVDYPANQMWPKLGFVAMREIDGRGRKGTRLMIWKYEYNQPTLFSFAAQQNESDKGKAVIDANIFYQLQYPDKKEYEESSPLLEPWLDIDLYLTPEIYNEISRSKDDTKKEATRKFIDSFNMVNAKSSDDRFLQIHDTLRQLFPQSLSKSDESDLRQLVYAIAAEIPFFITHDKLLLDKAEDVFERFGIQILRPSDLIVLQDELLRGSDYAPSRMAGTQIHFEKVHSQQSEKLIARFLSPREETKGNFSKRLQLALSNASTIDTFGVMDAHGEEYGLISYSRQIDNQLIVPIFRVGQSPICQIVARYLASNLVLTASAEGRNTIKIIDKYLPQKVISALQESEFFQYEDCWGKLTFQGVLSVNDAIAQLTTSGWPDFSQKHVADLLKILQSASNSAALLALEKNLWPLKIRELDIPVFIVPIRPQWAMQLFDVTIAEQDLFGGDPSLILNAENVYYRSGFQKVLSAPGRILWYVSSGDKRYQESMCIKACSYVDDVEIGKPKQLFSKYKRLGIYKWKDVYNDVAKRDLNKDIMAFKFSKTEIFKTPIRYSQLREAWKSEGQNFYPISPLRISSERFLSLYNLGMKGKEQ